MTRTELLEIIANGENSGVEFKRDDLRTQDLAKELVAFSNLQGGMVLLGVEDDGTITGLTRQDLEEWVMNVCATRSGPRSFLSSKRYAMSRTATMLPLSA